MEANSDHSNEDLLCLLQGKTESELNDSESKVSMNTLFDCFSLGESYNIIGLKYGHGSRRNRKLSLYHSSGV